MKKRKYLALFLAFSIMAAGCGGQDKGSGSAHGSVSAVDGSTSAGTEKDAVLGGGTSGNAAAVDASGIFSNRDLKNGYEESGSARIQLNGDSASCSSNAVQISGSTVTITDEGTYILSGTLDDGMIIVGTDKSDKVQLVLDNVAIHSETCAPIYILQSDKVFITMAAGSANTLSNGGVFTAIDENNIDAVIFSKEDLTLNGVGTLVITSPVGHGIVSKDSLKITSGSYDINCASHAISGKDDVCITNAEFTIVSGKDGIHAENADDASLGYVYIQSGAFYISAEGDGISASSSLQIEDGSFDITAGGGSVNAAAHNSDMWGGFQGGGMHGGGMRGGDFQRNEDFQKDENFQRDGDFQRGGDFQKGRDFQRNEDFQGDETPPDDLGGGTFEPDRPNDGAGGFNGGDGATDGVSGATGTPDTSDNQSDSTSMKGIKATTSLVINEGEFSINSADDSVHSNGTVTVNGGVFEIASGDDAFHADETLTVTAGTINITESYEGLEGAHVNISGGEITLTASDDGLNAAGGTDSSGSTGGRDGMFGGPGMASSGGSIMISGGTIKVTAYGDGLDANGSFEITGGNIIVSGPTQGDTAILDYDTSGTISGGTFIGTGASDRMAQTFSASEQEVITVSVGNQSAGTQIQLTDSKGNIVAAYTPELDFALVILSSPEIISGETYTLTAGTFSGECTAD